ncbi:MAG: beta-ketoacyl-ACP synthase II, partial [Proteobacteria bacterium]|nr:beta-ketoacyl-ACP synthase II [Pseudomonadota bacterium]
MRRVVVTGLGMVTPLACGVKPTWDKLLAGESGIGQITRFKVSDIACRIAGEVPEGGGEHDFHADDWVEPKDRRKIDRFILYAIAAARQAIDDAGWTPSDEESLERTGVMIGSGIGGLDSIAAGALLVEKRGPRRLSPFFIPSALI